MCSFMYLLGNCSCSVCLYSIESILLLSKDSKNSVFACLKAPQPLFRTEWMGSLMEDPCVTLLLALSKMRYMRNTCSLSTVFYFFFQQPVHAGIIRCLHAVVHGMNLLFPTIPATELKQNFQRSASLVNNLYVSQYCMSYTPCSFRSTVQYCV